LIIFGQDKKFGAKVFERPSYIIVAGRERGGRASSLKD